MAKLASYYKPKPIPEETRLNAEGLSDIMFGERVVNQEGLWQTFKDALKREWEGLKKGLDKWKHRNDAKTYTEERLTQAGKDKLKKELISKQKQIVDYLKKNKLVKDINPIKIDFTPVNYKKDQYDEYNDMWTMYKLDINYVPDEFIFLVGYLDIIQRDDDWDPLAFYDDIEDEGFEFNEEAETSNGVIGIRIKKDFFVKDKDYFIYNSGNSVNQEGILDFLKGLFKKKEVKTIEKVPLKVIDIKELPNATEVNLLPTPNIKDYTKDTIPNAMFAYNTAFFSKPSNIGVITNYIKSSIDKLTKFVGKKQPLAHEDDEGDYIWPAFTELKNEVSALANIANKNINVTPNNGIFTDGEASDTDVITYAFSISYDNKDYFSIIPVTLGIHPDVEYPMVRMEDYGDICTEPQYHYKDSINKLSVLANPKDVYKELTKLYSLFNNIHLDKVKYVNNDNESDEYEALNNGVKDMLIYLKNTLGVIINLSIDYLNEIEKKA